ncbi:unnamed protein product [Prorocentrum cordatum]|uniref:CCR4-NOT transcription complex subunit 1 CAF1-binding domain-containing protein n=1 Tax=Prorocentrum cordatum TaxID=2364126 RepID=A0ABN9REE3_9DINO|nr:unnamed protein product [Polarella glacialis]
MHRNCAPCCICTGFSSLHAQQGSHIGLACSTSNPSEPRTWNLSEAGSLIFGATAAADSLLSDPDLQLERPAAWVQDAVAAIFNSLVKDNLEAKAEEMRSVVQPEHHAWLAHYLVKSRASREAKDTEDLDEYRKAIHNLIHQVTQHDRRTNINATALRVTPLTAACGTSAVRFHTTASRTYFHTCNYLGYAYLVYSRLHHSRDFRELFSYLP